MLGKVDSSQVRRAKETCQNSKKTEIPSLGVRCSSATLLNRPCNARIHIFPTISTKYYIKVWQTLPNLLDEFITESDKYLIISSS